MAIRSAIINIQGQKPNYGFGLTALSPNARASIRYQNPRNIDGSAYLDDVLSLAYPGRKTWDYLIGNKKGSRYQIIYIEVHPASSSDVSDMIEKFKTLTSWLNVEARTLQSFPSDYVWIASGSITIRKGSRQSRILAQSGLKFPVPLKVIDK